jgi:anti-sigma factor ChrR (cupin superfamily)
LDWIGGPGGRFVAFPLGAGGHDPVVVIVEYAPGTVIGVHHHRSDYYSMVLFGSMEVTRRAENPGSIRHVRAETAYGPLVIGDEGCTVLEVFADRQTFVEPVFVGALRSGALDLGTPADNPMPAMFALAMAQAVQRLGQIVTPDSM